MVSNSGFEDIHYKADICGIKGAMSWKHYNRSWVVYECFSEALEYLFFKCEYNALQFDAEFLVLVRSIKNKDSCNELIDNPTFDSYFKKYSSIKQQYLRQVSQKG